jgi:hypothetical protein
LIFIHGGGFCAGSTSQFGYEIVSDNFVSQGIIVITLQYRLGMMGMFYSLIDYYQKNIKSILFLPQRKFTPKNRVLRNTLEKRLFDWFYFFASSSENKCDLYYCANFTFLWCPWEKNVEFSGSAKSESIEFIVVKRVLTENIRRSNLRLGVEKTIKKSIFDNLKHCVKFER